MNVTLLDTQTGETRKHSGAPPFWWEHGNGTCDCNREIQFGRDTSVNECIGANRYLVIAAEHEPERDKEEQPPSLFDLNSDYPVELLTEHGITP